MKIEIDIYNSYLEVDLGQIKRNVEKIKAGIGADTDIIGVVKGNANGMGLVEVGKHLVENCGIKILGCASVFEGVTLRDAGVDGEILVMGGIPCHIAAAVVKYGLQTPAYDMEYLKLLDIEAEKAGKKALVHIKVETGLNRIGVKPGDDMEALCSFLKSLNHIKVCGIFTHFIQSGNPDKTVTYEQMDKFSKAVSQVKAHGFELSYIHVANSAASTWLKDPIVTHIRPGALLYGFDDNFDENMDTKNLFGLSEALSWRAYITNVKTIQAGESAGYDRYFKATKPTDIATVSIGYGDGYTRTLGTSGKGEMLVNGKRAKVVAICMDQLFLDVTGIPAKTNDIVTVLGKDGEDCISVLGLQKRMNQTHLALISVITNRVGRKYIRTSDQ
ncbi:MAG: alanine racemase [Defluviitaleaceae bacterium]|nr:alanine racemase [Defluviitaleaceae bacterium]